jgi:DNA-binding GntR family transcriptional regulator
MGDVNRATMADDSIIQKRTMAEEVADVLRGRILAGRLKAGEPIRQEHVAKELGVSRIPLREALSQLAAEGFVSLVAHKGAVVAPLSSAEVEELFELRLVLEDRLLTRAIPRLDAADFDLLDDLIAQSMAPDGLKRWGELNWRLHEAMYLPAGRPVTLKLLKRVHDNIDRYLRLEIALSQAGRERGYREHRQLVDLCRARDIEGARALLAAHIGTTADNLAASLKARAL